MSQANVAVARRAYERLQADDIDGMLRYVHPSVEWHSLVLEMEGTFHGHDGVREWWNNIRSVFPDWHPTLQEVQAFGNQVVVHARFEGSGTGSGVGVDDDFWQVAEIREGLIVEYAAYRTEGEALAAVRASG